MTPVERDLEPGERWVFDGSVADVFEQMLRRSIPELDRMRALTTLLGREFAEPGSSIVDLGAARGDALAPFVEIENERDPKRRGGTTFYAIETAAPMLDVLRERFAHDLVVVVDADLRDGLPRLVQHPVSLTLAILTLQFVPVDHRLRLLRDVREATKPGGALIVVEKTLPTPALDRIFLERYWDAKREEGYSDDEIVRKSLALEGVLVPLPVDWTEDALRRVGFREVEGFWRWLQFSGWVAVA